MAIGGHYSALMDKDEWLTPPLLLRVLGQFDLDPCSPINRPWDTAMAHYTKLDNGLMKPWVGRVWCNPPYGAEAERWLARLADHGNGIALVFARTETKMFFDHVWPKASALLFIEGRLKFYHIDGSEAHANSGGPSVLIAYGENNFYALKDSGIPGKIIKLQPENL